MAAKNPAAEKAAKQKKMLIILGVLLVGVGAFQIPKLMGGSKSATADTTATTTATGAAAPAPVADPAATGVVTPAPVAELLPGENGKTQPTATLGGVKIVGGTLVRASEGQLASFSLFKPKDPFSPGVTTPKIEDGDTIGTKPGKGGDDGTNASLGSGATTGTTTASSGEADSGVTAVDPNAGTTGDPAVTTPEKPSTTPAKGTEPVTTPVTTTTTTTSPTVPETTPAEPVVPPTFATVSVNGLAESLEVEKHFPTDGPIFVLAQVKAKGIEIGIADGALEKGKTVHIGLGRTVTLVDSASGVTYAIKLISVGTSPDVEFTTGASTPAVAGGGATLSGQPTSTSP